MKIKKNLDWMSTFSNKYYSKIEDLSIVVKGPRVKNEVGLELCPAYLEVNEENSQEYKEIDIISARTLSAIIADKFSKDIKYDVIIEDIAYIDLQKTKDDLKRNLRKSYKSLVNKNQDVYVVDKNESNHYIELARKLHIEISGKITRAKESWDVMAESLQDEKGILIVKGKREIIDGYCFFFCNEMNAYYSSSVMKERKGAHSLLWAGVIKAKDMGLSNLIMDYIKIEEIEDSKLKNIRHFKEGFGLDREQSYIIKKINIGTEG